MVSELSYVLKRSRDKHQFDYKKEEEEEEEKQVSFTINEHVIIIL